MKYFGGSIKQSPEIFDVPTNVESWNNSSSVDVDPVHALWEFDILSNLQISAITAEKFSCSPVLGFNVDFTAESCRFDSIPTLLEHSGDEDTDVFQSVSTPIFFNVSIVGKFESFARLFGSFFSPTSIILLITKNCIPCKNESSLILPFTHHSTLDATHVGILCVLSYDAVSISLSETFGILIMLFLTKNWIPWMKESSSISPSIHHWAFVLIQGGISFNEQIPTLNFWSLNLPFCNQTYPVFSERKISTWPFSFVKNLSS